MRKTLYVLAFMFLLAGCAHNESIQARYGGVSEDRYPKLDVVVYERSFLEYLDETMHDLDRYAGNGERKSRKSGSNDPMRYF